MHAHAWRNLCIHVYPLSLYPRFSYVHMYYTIIRHRRSSRVLLRCTWTLLQSVIYLSICCRLQFLVSLSLSLTPLSLSLSLSLARSLPIPLSPLKVRRTTTLYKLSIYNLSYHSFYPHLLIHNTLLGTLHHYGMFRPS